MSVRRAMIRRRFSTFPMPIHEFTSHVGVHVHGNRAPDVHDADSGCFCCTCGCATAAGAAMPIRPSRPWLGATPEGGLLPASNPVW